MKLSIVVLDVEMWIDLDLPTAAGEAVEQQWERIKDSDEGQDRFTERLLGKIPAALAECLDWDLRPPTDAQVNFATGLARQLGLALPAEVLTRRDAMARFLDEHAGSARGPRAPSGPNQARASRTLKWPRPGS